MTNNRGPPNSVLEKVYEFGKFTTNSMSHTLATTCKDLRVHYGVWFEDKKNHKESTQWCGLCGKKK